MMGKTIKELGISIAILTVPPENVRDVAEEAVRHGVRGILNFTTIPVNVPSGIHLEEYDMITSLEKVAYYVKENRKQSFVQ